MTTPGAGDLNYRIVIQAKGSSKDGFGQVSSGWSDVATVWGNIESSSGQETETGSVVSLATSKITIRWNSTYASTITAAKYRLTSEGRIFNVHAALPDRVGGRIVFLASEGSNDG